jgi:ribosome-associated protein
MKSTKNISDHDSVDLHDDSINRPSKSEVKRQLAEIFIISENLLSYTEKNLLSVGFSESLVSSILEASQMPLAEARKRQIKFIAKQLRDSSMFSLKDMMTQLASNKNTGSHLSKEKLKQSKLSPLAQKLVDGDNQALQDFCEKNISADRQHLRNLIRNVIKHNSDKSRLIHYTKELNKYLESSS